MEVTVRLCESALPPNGLQVVAIESTHDAAATTKMVMVRQF